MIAGDEVAHRRSAEYSDTVRFWRAELQASPTSPLAMENLAQALIERRQLAGYQFVPHIVGAHQQGLDDALAADGVGQPF